MAEDSTNGLVRSYFSALSRGELGDELLTQDATFWSMADGRNDRSYFADGVRGFAALFDGGPCYDVRDIIDEDGRVVAEVRGHGRMHNGLFFENTYVYLFGIRDGRISSVAEHCSPAPMLAAVQPV